MKRIALVAFVSAFSIGIHSAQADTCKAQATQKNLAGAALTSFMTKCQKDAKEGCDAQAQQKNLAGAAKASFTKKCNDDAIGN